VRSAADGKLGQGLAAFGIDERSGVLGLVQNDKRLRARGQSKPKERNYNRYEADFFHCSLPSGHELNWQQY
jgi:hypothetical protein